MGTFLYLTLRFAKLIDHDDDLINICQLVAIDSVAFSVMVLAWVMRRRAK